MRRLYILDTTLRDGEQSLSISLDAQKKLEISHQIAKLGVDVIETGFPASSPEDFKAVQAISKEMKGIKVCGLARCIDKDIESCLEALEPAEYPRINLGIAVSPIHMDKKLRLTPRQVVAKAVSAVKYAKKSIGDVQFYAEDAMRSDPKFLVEIFEKVIAAGATVITISDTVGCATPWTMERLVSHVKNTVRNIDKAQISIHCHDDLGMATANSLIGIRAGADQVECTINGIGERAGNASLEEIVMAIRTQIDRGNNDAGNIDNMDNIDNIEININTREIYASCQLVSMNTGIPIPRHKAIVGENAYSHASGIHQDGMLKEQRTYQFVDPLIIGAPPSRIILSARSGRSALKYSLEKSGFKTDDQDIDKLYQKFIRLADGKQAIANEELPSLLLNHKYPRTWMNLLWSKLDSPRRIGIISETILNEKNV